MALAEKDGAVRAGSRPRFRVLVKEHAQIRLGVNCCISVYCIHLLINDGCDCLVVLEGIVELGLVGRRLCVAVSGKIKGCSVVLVDVLTCSIFNPIRRQLYTMT